MKLPFDNTTRRRLYLVRHGQAAAVSERDGLYGNAIRLTERGQAEAEAMRDALSDVNFGEAYCSVIQRARQTAEVILQPHGIEPRETDRFIEIQGDLAPTLTADIPLRDRQAAMSYMMWTATHDAARFFGGEVFADYIRRAGESLAWLVKGATDTNTLVVSHSGFQRAALCWALDAVPLGMAAFEQDTCCLNILDVDVNDDGSILRKHVRLANYTPRDPVKQNAVLTDGEELASSLMARLARMSGSSSSEPAQGNAAND